MIPVGEKLKLIECKWSEMPDRRVRGFQEVSRLVGEENILSRTIVTPFRGTRVLGDVTVGDSVEWPALERP